MQKLNNFLIEKVESMKTELDIIEGNPTKNSTDILEFVYYSSDILATSCACNKHEDIQRRAEEFSEISNKAKKLLKKLRR